MRNIITISAAFMIAGILQISSADILIGEERSSDDVRREAHRQWSDVANGRTEFDISDPALLPTQLALVASRSGCRWKDVIKDVPVHVFKIGNRRFAKVTCFGFGYLQQIYDLRNRTNPEALEFPVASSPEGFSTTSRLGSITWKPESGLLESVGSSDQCGTSGIRHTYRWINEQFSVIRVEISPENCDSNGPWTTIWEAPQWSSLIPQPKAR
jgi:hypothetical protein